MIEKTTGHYSFYELDNDSGYKIYYVNIYSFAGGKYYSRTFVDENDYDSVLEYYNTSNLEISALWRTAPRDYDDGFEFEIRSNDGVFTINLVIYTEQNEMKLYLNEYEVEENIIEKHKVMLLGLINDAQEELLEK